MSARAKPKKTSAERTRAWRARMRAQGLKPVTIWTLDVNDPVFRARLAESLTRWGKSADEEQVQREMDEHFDAVMADEPDYDWGPHGPPG